MCTRGLRGDAVSLFLKACEEGFFSDIDWESDITPEGTLIWGWLKESSKESLQSNQSSVQAPHSDEIQSIETIK